MREVCRRGYGIQEEDGHVQVERLKYVDHLPQRQ